ncbi:MAG: spike base protein, RCAP_Rcc01079 family [Roseovarius sp.]
MPILDIFEDHLNGLTGPICGGFDVTPSDAADLLQMTRGVMVASAGDLAVVLKSGDAVTLPALSPGVIYPIRIARVLATGTTATGIKGLV